MTDFELAAKQTLLLAFSAAEQIGCYFYLGQSVWCHIQAECLQKRYQSDSAFVLDVHFNIAIVFVPLNDVNEASKE